MSLSYTFHADFSSEYYIFHADFSCEIYTFHADFLKVFKSHKLLAGGKACLGVDLVIFLTDFGENKENAVFSAYLAGIMSKIRFLHYFDLVFNKRIGLRLQKK